MIQLTRGGRGRLSAIGPTGLWRAGSLSAIVLLGACDEILPTASGGDLNPVEARTFQVDLPFSVFANSAQVFGGFSSGVELEDDELIIADDLDGALDVRPLVRFSTLIPDSIFARNAGGETVVDTMPFLVGGTVLVRFDTLDLDLEAPVQITASAIETEWEPFTTSWEMAVDTFGARLPWPEPGGGPARVLDQIDWSPADGDSIVIAVDSATAVQWVDADDNARGMRLEVQGPGRSLRITEMRFISERQSTIQPDTIFRFILPVAQSTYIYNPGPADPVDELRVGGVPAWRSVIDIDLPEFIDGTPEICAITECPLRLDPERVNSAALVLTTREPAPGFVLSDTLIVDLLQVLDPDLLPKSPLNPDPITGASGLNLAPEWFEGGGGIEIASGMTGFIRLLLQEDTEFPVPSTVSILTRLEPNGLGFGSFWGPGTPDEPRLRLVITVTDGVNF